MTIGDKQVAAPTFATSYGTHVAPPREGETVYIHPEGRFYTLEFKSQVTGESFRECYYFADRLTAEERKEICDLSRS